MLKQWKYIEFEQCPKCGDDLEGFTTCEPEGMFYDGDQVRCLGKCGAALSISCDEGEAWISWNNEQED